MWQAIEGEQSRKAILLRQLFIFRDIFLSEYFSFGIGWAYSEGLHWIVSENRGVLGTPTEHTEINHSKSNLRSCP